jgi:hypothetical protein
VGAEGRDGGRDERFQGALTGLCRCDLARPTSEPTGAAARLLKLLRSEAGHERIVRLEVRELGRFSTSVARLVPPVVIGREKSVCLALPPQLSDEPCDLLRVALGGEASELHVERWALVRRHPLTVLA